MTREADFDENLIEDLFRMMPPDWSVQKVGGTTVMLLSPKGRTVHESPNIKLLTREAVSRYQTVWNEREALVISKSILTKRLVEVNEKLKLITDEEDLDVTECRNGG